MALRCRDEKAGTAETRSFEPMLGLIDEIDTEFKARAEEQRQAESELRQELEQALAAALKNEKSFRAIFENSPIGIAQLGSDLKFIAVNPALLEMFGYSEAELLGMTAVDVSHPDDRRATRDLLPRILRNGGLQAYEKRYIHKSGRVIWGKVSSRLVQLEPGGEPQLFAAVLDITGLREQKLQNAMQNQLLTSVLDNLPILVFAKDASDGFKFTLVNKYGEELIGLDESEMVGRTVHELFPREQADFFEQKDRDVFALGTKITIEREQMLSTKGQRWLKTYKVPIYRPNGSPDLLVGISVDITDDIEAEEERKRLIDENRAILKSARFAIITTDLHGTITSFNDEAERILGYSASEIIGRCTLAEFHDRHEMDRVAAQISKEFLRPVPVGFETIAFRAARGEADERQWSYIRKDGQRVPVLLSVTALCTTGGEIYGFMGIAKDLTAELALQRALEADKARALHSAKMASLGEMSAGIAHEINNPLAIISGNLRILQELRRDDVKFESRTAAMIKAAARIEKIVKGLQKFSRGTENRDHKVEDLAGVLAESVSMAEVRAKRFATPISLEIAGQPRILCDAVEIEQVLINLINNGIDAVKGQDEKWVKVRAFADDSQVMIQVIDSGPGIPVEIERKIFQPFFTTKPIGEGTGLGLSIARGIIEQHRASIALNRAVDKTCFELRFPLTEGAANGA